MTVLIVVLGVAAFVCAWFLMSWLDRWATRHRWFVDAYRQRRIVIKSLEKKEKV